ncbi:MAG: FAD binding domain-containing protein [Thermomicrobiales bacterium]|nr:FAD binding domain-containing protein [Thermomicrobiales bacterium]
MNLNTIEEIRPARLDLGAAIEWDDGDAWLAGGTWLFSEPQPNLRRLLDLQTLGWPPLIVDEEGLRIAATCTVADLAAFAPPPDWTAAFLIGECCHAFLASFKIWNAATVGGNICMALPAGPMITLTSALEGRCEIWRRDGTTEMLPVAEFVTGSHENALRPGDLLRAMHLPATALRKRAALRRMSLTHFGRSTAFPIGTVDPDDGSFLLTVTASTKRPEQLAFDALPTASELRERLHEAIPDARYHDDVHGTPAYRKHLTSQFAEEIRGELAADRPS